MGNCCKSKILDNFDKNTPNFSLYDYKSKVKILELYDNYNLLVIIPLFNQYYKFLIKLANIKMNEIAKKRLLELILTNSKYNSKTINDNVIISIKCCRINKHGKLLCWLYPYKTNYEKSFNKILIEENLV